MIDKLIFRRKDAITIVQKKGGKCIISILYDGSLPMYVRKIDWNDTEFESGIKNHLNEIIFINK